MCGIAAVHDLSTEAGDHDRLRATREIGEDLLSRLHHRGPDGSGTRQVGPTWLGHTRLAIVDLDGGEQPLRSRDGDRWVVANGEIYNHDELRARAGRPVRAPTPTPRSCCTSLGRLGTDGIHDLRGMYAFCVAGRDGEVVLARDPLGVKPLYWARADDRVLAASELVAFPEHLRRARRGVPARAPLDAGRRRAAVRRPAHRPARARRRAGTAVHRRARRHARPSATSLVAGVRERMMADVPVGVFLSGGLDSSIVAAILARSAAPGTVVRSFAAGTEGSADLAAARVVAEHLGLEHHERVYTDDDVVAVLPEVVRATESYEPSLVRSAVPNYLLAELAARHLKVVLTGEGADELFAGYHHFREMDVVALRDALADGVDGAAPPQPAALRPGDDGARPRGAGAVPVARHARAWRSGSRWSGSCSARTARSRRRRRRCCARRSRAGCPRRSCGGARSSSATAPAPPT